MFCYCRRLIDLCRSVPLITTGAYELVAREHPQVYAYWRRGRGEALFVVANFYGEPTTLDLPPEVAAHEQRVTLISNEQPPPAELDGCVVLRPYEAFAWHLRGVG